MAAAVYILGFLTSLACAVLLLRGYVYGKRPLLFWSGLCFIGLAVSNVLIFVDLVILPDVNLYHLRLGVAAVAMAMLLYGLIWESN
jgi:hypothetical protein